MTDKEILEEVHRKLGNIYSIEDLFVEGDIKAVRSFIEEEWQKRDEKEMVDQHNRNRKVEDHIVDVAEIERHRGLVIGEDGTVKEIL